YLTVWDVPERSTERMDVHMQMAEAVRQACLAAALQAYEDAGLSGLCHEGRWECAVGAIRAMPLRPLVHALVRAAEPDARGAPPRRHRGGRRPRVVGTSAVTSDAAQARAAETHPSGHPSTAGSVVLT